jgi:hypothetical protein
LTVSNAQDTIGTQNAKDCHGHYGNTQYQQILKNSYLCNQLGNALFCVTSGIFAGRAQRDPAKSHELHKIAFPNVLHTRFFLILTKKKFLQTLNEVINFINNKLLSC